MTCWCSVCLDQKKKLIVDAIGEVALGEEELLGVVIEVVLNEKDIVKDIVSMALASRRHNWCELGLAASDLVCGLIPSGC
jgi:hypothetical protein